MHNVNLKAEVISTIDELNQYLLGNVTNEAAIDALTSLAQNIKEH